MKSDHDTPADPLNLPVPKSKTALMQHLQRLVSWGTDYWVGGVISPQKFGPLVQKLAQRYPLTRGQRGREYDRQQGRAAVYLVAFPTGDRIAWWVLSGPGKGGLGDPASPDYKAAKRAGAKGEHIVFEDYTLLYATKKERRELVDKRTNETKSVLKDTSTWTWKMTSKALNEVRAELKSCADRLDFGWDDSGTRPPSGLRGALYYQRRRPLFSGVRTQVFELHREAEDLWGTARQRWLAKNGKAVRHALVKQNPELGEDSDGARKQLSERMDQAGKLTPAVVIAKTKLPTMKRMEVYGDAPKLLRDLLTSA